MLRFLIVSAIVLLFVPWYGVFAVMMTIVLAWLCGSDLIGYAFFRGSIVVLAVLGWVVAGCTFLDGHSRCKFEQAQASLEWEREKQRQARQR
jgi:uncharacterized membrane protein (DUF441 family)